MAVMWLLYPQKKNKPITTTNSPRNVLGSLGTRRRRAMTILAVGILLTWTCTTMRWIASSPSSLSNHDDWRVPTAAKNDANDTSFTSFSSSFRNATSSSSSSISSPLDKIKVPLPIYIPSLPKSGTTSLHRYFICGQIWTAHTYVNTLDLQQMRVGECIQNNLASMNMAPLDNCGTYKVFGDDGYIRGNRCYYPSLHGALPAFAKAYGKNSGGGDAANGITGGFTLLYIRRSSQAWIKSMRHWKDGNLLRKWRACDAPFPQNNKNATDEEWMQFYEFHAQTMRQFASDHADVVTFIEVDLEDVNIAQILEEKTGIDASCWGHHNSHEKRLRLNPKFRAKALALQQQQQQETQTSQP